MSYRLPPLNGLRSFEAAARHLSFTRAADELGVTPGAVSQQVKSLEGVLGIVPQLMKTPAATCRLRQAAVGDDAVMLRPTGDLAELLNGRVDMLLRGAGGAHPGLQVDRLIVAGADQTPTPMVLLTHPGLAGYREHQRLIRRLQETTWSLSGSD